MQVCVHFYLIFRRKWMIEEQGVLQGKCLLLGYVMGSVTSNEPPRYLQGITNDSSLAWRTIRRNKRKKCTGESGDIGDIAKIVNIAMQIFIWG